VHQSQAPEKSALLAAALQAAFPPLPLGYVYAGDLGRCLLSTGLMVGGSTLFLINALDWVDWDVSEGSTAWATVGLAALVGGYVWGIWDAADAARDANAEARARVGLSLGVEPGGRVSAGLRVGL
jgi:hypothetical protein